MKRDLVKNIYIINCLSYSICLVCHQYFCRIAVKAFVHWGVELMCCAVPTNLDILPRNVFRYNKGRPSVEKYQHRYLTGLMSLLPFNLICKDYLVSKFSGVFPFRFISSRNHQSELHYWLLDFFADVDECSSSIPVCDPNANCQNTEGSFRCQCMPGFSGDRKSCTGKVF